jgi:hypothetical protein
MSLNILLVFPQAQRDLAKEIRNLLEDLPQAKETDADVMIKWNVNSARESLAERHYRFDLIIVNLYLPPDSQSPLDHSVKLGLSFLQELKKNKRRLPSILVAPVKDDKLPKDVKELGDTDLVLAGADFEEELRLSVLRKLKTAYCEPAAKPVHTVAEPKRERIFGNVDIWLNLHSQPYSPTHCPGQFEMNIYQPGSANPITFIGSGALWLDWTTLYDLAIKSKDLENLDKYPWPRWKEELEALGGSLRKEICEKEEKFQTYFKCLLRKVHNNIQNTRIRFKLSLASKDDKDPRARFSADLQAVVLEALLDDQRKFLMLQAPVFRRLDPSVASDDEYQFPLFYRGNGEKPLKCLIIESDTQGIVEFDNTKTLETLTHILSKDRLPEKISFLDWVTTTLEEKGPWDLVHYAGHSMYDAEDRTGYVFFPGEKIAKAVTIDQFSRHLRKAQVRFVYVSSCQSSRDDFVFQLANNLVPAILGFRWKIDDKEAKEYAMEFYQDLLKYHSLEQAFLEARKYVHEKYEDNRIWVSPLLVLQTP